MGCTKSQNRLLEARLGGVVLLCGFCFQAARCAMSEVIPIVPMPVSDEKIGELKEAFSELSAETSEGYKEVKKAIQVCVKTRTSIDGKRVELNEEALQWQRRVNAEAKRLTALVEEIEHPLKAKKQAVDARAEQARKDYEAKQQAWLQGRLDECLTMTGNACPVDVAERMSDQDWHTFIAEGTAANAARLSEEMKRRTIEETERRKLRESVESWRIENEKLQNELESLRREKAERERLERERIEEVERERVAAEKQAMEEMQRAKDSELKAKCCKIISNHCAEYLNLSADVSDMLASINAEAFRGAIGPQLDEAIKAVGAMCEALDRFDANVPF